MDLFTLRKKASQAETSDGVLGAVRDLEAAIKADEALQADIATRRLVLLPTATVAEIRALDEEAANALIRVEQGKINLTLMKQRAAELKTAEKLARIEAAMTEHNKLIAEHMANMAKVSESAARLLPLRMIVEQEGHGIAGGPHLPPFPMLAYNMAAMQSVHPTVQPPPELYTWEQGCRDAEAAFRRSRKAARRAA